MLNQPKEFTGGRKPELATQIENLDSYDVIFLKYPNWNADLPMPQARIKSAQQHASQCIKSTMDTYAKVKYNPVFNS